MPILHLQYSGEGKDPSGKVFTLQPSVAMQMRGPCVQVVISLGTAMTQALQQKGDPIPTPVSGLALLDTGATGTCIDAKTAEAMKLPVIDVGKMTSATHEDTDQNIHPIKIEIIGSPIAVDVERAMTANLTKLGFIAIIGRDFMQHGTIFYNGVAGTITLSL